jgi:hypothetical protein
MLVFRSVVLGLLGACCLLLAQRPSIEAPQRFALLRVPAEPGLAIDIHLERAAPTEAAPQQPARIVDVAFAQLDAPDKIFDLLALAPDEQIVAVNDQRVHSETHMREVLGHLAPSNYIDFDVTSPRGRQRVLMLFH